MIIYRPIALAAAGALALAGCSPSYLPEEDTNTRAGAAIGAAVGGLYGLTRDGDNKLLKGVVGATIGGATGGVIGQQLDKQQREIEQAFVGTGVSVKNTGSELIVTLPQDITFDLNSAEVRPDLAEDIRQLSVILTKYPDSTIEVFGHTDNTGTAELNQNLSTDRAASVANIMMDNGIRPSRVIAIGRGEDQPIATNQTDAGRAQNRRVEIVVTPTAA